MRKLNKTTSRTLDRLTQGLEIGGARKVDTGSYMPVHVDRLTENRYSVAHYYRQNGDSVCDPDGEFLKVEGGWLPVALQLCTGHYSRCLELEGDTVTGYRPGLLRELRSFCTTWMRNIRSQQDLSEVA